MQSPSFTPVLSSVFLASTGESTPSGGELSVTPGGTLQVVARGLYSTPPGTLKTATNTECFPDANLSTHTAPFCTLGPVSGVTFSVDPSSDSTGRQFASIDANGLVRGLRRGRAVVRGRLDGFSEVTRTVLIDGPVLKTFTITALDVKNNKPFTANETPSVPVGRNIALTGVASCQTGFNDTANGNTEQGGANGSQNLCTNQNYGFSWSLPAATPADTVVFIPSSATGETIAITLKRFGPFSIEASIINEEGDRIEATRNLAATQRVLDDVIVAADPVQSEPVPVLRGTTTRFHAMGQFSDGAVAEITSADLSANSLRTDSGKLLKWAQDSSAIGGPITIDDSTSGGVNSSALVKADPAAAVGLTGLTATGFNIESTPVQVDDRVAISVQDAGLLRITRICLRQDLGTACTSDIQIPLSQVLRLKARGQFTNDAAGVERDIDPEIFPITYSSAPGPNQANIAVNVDADGDTNPDAGSVKGNALGIATVVVALNDGVAPLVVGGDREARKDVTVIDSRCLDQLLLSNNTAASTAGEAGNTVENAGNVIDFDQASFGTYTVSAAGLLGGLLPIGGAADPVSMIFRRDGNTVTPPPLGQPVGFTLAYNPDEFSTQLATIITLNATGQEVERFENPSASSFTAGGETRFSIQATARQPFSGLQLEITSPPVDFNISDLPGLLDLILGGGNIEVKAYSACANVRP